MVFLQIDMENNCIIIEKILKPRMKLFKITIFNKIANILYYTFSKISVDNSVPSIRITNFYF